MPLAITATSLTPFPCTSQMPLGFTGGGGGGGGGGTSSSSTPNPAGTLVAIAVTPSMPSIKAGTTQQFKATGTYFNSSTGVTSTADITGSVAWSSSATNVATISAAGLAAGSGNGVTTITAASGFINGTTTLSVVTWTSRMFGQGIPQALVWSGTSYVGAGGFYNSTDSRNWTSTNANGAANDLAWDGSLYVAVGTAWFYVSADGVNWTTAALPASVSSQSFYAVAKSSTTWVAVGGGGSIVYSTDGKTWTAAPTLTINTPTITNYAPVLHAVAWTGTQFVVGGEIGRASCRESVLYRV